MYTINAITYDEIYPVDKGQREYVLNEQYAKRGSSGEEYYPKLNYIHTLVLIDPKDDITPIFIQGNSSMSCVNFEDRININGMNYYYGSSDSIGNFYIHVMTKNKGNNIYYKKWKSADSQLKQPFDYSHTHIFNDDKVNVYKRGNNYFRFFKSEEIAVDVSKNHYYWDPVTLTYFDINVNGQKLYFDINEPLKHYYNDKGQWILGNGVIYDNKQPLPITEEFSQTMDMDGHVICISNSKRVFEFKTQDKIQMLDYSYGWRYKYPYHLDSDGKKQYVHYSPFAFNMPLNMKYDEPYSQSQDGGQIYPKHEGNEFCNIHKLYAKNSENKFYYPRNSQGDHLILVVDSNKKLMIEQDGLTLVKVPLSDKDKTFKFLLHTYVIDPKNIKSELTLLWIYVVAVIIISVLFRLLT